MNIECHAHSDSFIGIKNTVIIRLRRIILNCCSLNSCREKQEVQIPIFIALEQPSVFALRSYAGHGKGGQQTLQGSRLLFTLPCHGVKAKFGAGSVLFILWQVIEKLPLC
ncbi:MAG: hypothetical protein PHO37_00825 [Kiritimatiellae bacterium]|nr:hypothetical protein [Kiritimatiellia bacterium]